MVHQRIDPAKSCDTFRNDPLCGFGVTEIAGDGQDALSFDGLIKRDVATTR